MWLFPCIMGFLSLFLIPYWDMQGTKQHLENYKMNIKRYKTQLIIAWTLNFIAFSVCLWLGEYAMHSGVEWIRTPCSITLGSCGAIKIVLSFMLFISMFSIDKGEEK